MCATSMCYMLMSLRQKSSPRGPPGSPPQCSVQLKSDVAVFGNLMSNLFKVFHRFASRFTWTFRKLPNLALALFIHGLKSGIMGNVHLKMCPQNNVQKSPSFCQTFEFQNISLEVSSFLSFFYIYFLHIKKYL